jgi:hypothetical protein
MKKIALFAIIALTAGCIDATAKIKRYEKVLFVLTSHSELGTQEKKTGFGQKNLLPYYELADKSLISQLKEVNHRSKSEEIMQLQRIPKDLTKTLS